MTLHVQALTRLAVPKPLPLPPTARSPVVPTPAKTTPTATTRTG